MCLEQRVFLAVVVVVIRVVPIDYIIIGSAPLTCHQIRVVCDATASVAVSAVAMVNSNSTTATDTTTHMQTHCGINIVV